LRTEFDVLRLWAIVPLPLKVGFENVALNTLSDEKGQLLDI
jgi:hypothetical protein